MQKDYLIDMEDVVVITKGEKGKGKVIQTARNKDKEEDCGKCSKEGSKKRSRPK